MTSDEQVVLDTVKSFLNALNAKEYARMHDYINPPGAAILRRNGTDTVQITIPELIGMAEKIVTEVFSEKTFEETFDDAEVRIDEDLAMVWAKCRVIYGGEVVGNGANVFSLHKMADGSWKISAVVDRLVMAS